MKCIEFFRCILKCHCFCMSFKMQTWVLFFKHLLSQLQYNFEAFFQSRSASSCLHASFFFLSPHLTCIRTQLLSCPASSSNCTLFWRQQNPNARISVYCSVLHLLSPCPGRFYARPLPPEQLDWLHFSSPPAAVCHLPLSRSLSFALVYQFFSAAICLDLCFCTSLSKVTRSLWRMLYLDLAVCVFFSSKLELWWWCCWVTVDDWGQHSRTAAVTVASLHLIGLMYVVGSSKGWSVLSDGVLKRLSCICIMFDWTLCSKTGDSSRTQSGLVLLNIGLSQ